MTVLSRTTLAPSYSGWLVLYKPPGLSSNHALQRVRRLLGRPKMGHAGTLDPQAFGILPLALGEATKVVSFLAPQRKTYIFEVTWGQERSTDDAEGDVISESTLLPSLEAIQSILPQFVGHLEQLPPQYSAKKVGGRRACDLRRFHGQEAVQLKSAAIEIDQLELLAHTGAQSQFQVTCSSGTYVRAIARDMGRILGCFGYAASIERTAVGPFRKSLSISLEKLEENIKIGIVQELIRPIQAVLDDIPAVLVTEDAAQRLRCGQQVGLTVGCASGPVGTKTQSGTVVVYDAAQRLVALAKLDQDVLAPQRVFNL